ncbi:MAG: phosphatidate cytidylyltransferase [Endomicrobiales bacterium]|nr:phosphatidate cytidylyltransferase [Endomicrobiales bacterium]
MLLPRLITALIGIPLVLICIKFGGIAFLLLMLFVVVFALTEYFLLVKQAGYASQPIIGTITGIVLFLSIYVNGTQNGMLSHNLGTPAILSFILLPVFLYEIIAGRINRSIESVGITFLGAFFIPWALGHLILIRDFMPDGAIIVYFLFAVIWVLDTGAYFFGRKFGKHKLAPLVSPKKTIEGLIGGVVTGALASWGFVSIVHFAINKTLFSTTEAIIIGVVVALISQFSDLSESLLKRNANVKDSAELLPGHGGMLDRFDSFLFTAPFFYYYLTIIKGF